MDARYVQGFYFCKPVAPENLKNIGSTQTLRIVHTSLPTRDEIPEYITLSPDFKFGKFLDVIEKFGRRYVIINVHATDYLIDLWKLKLQNLCNANKEFYLCYIDIDNFKAFNDTYGFYAGESRRKEKVSVCHIGGDDFAMVIWDFPVEDMLEELLQLLSENRERGYFISTDRDGDQKDFPIASISMALVRGSSNIVEISKRSAQLKKKAKACGGSALAVEFLNEILTINL